jgi:hypothetical protein
VQSGAAAGSGAAAEALRGLIRLLALTLSDASTAALRPREPDQAARLAGVRSAAGALAALEGLGRRAAELAAGGGGSSPEAAPPSGPPPLPPVPAPIVATNSTFLTVLSLPLSGSPQHALECPIQDVEGAHAQVPGPEPGKFTVRRDAAWVAGSAARLAPLLARTLPPLASHKSHAVRAALAEGAPLNTQNPCMCCRTSCAA